MTIHFPDTVLAPVKCGGSSAGFTAPTCRQCRSDYSHDFECRGDCFWRNEDDYPNRPDSLRCTWEGKVTILSDAMKPLMHQSQISFQQLFCISLLPNDISLFNQNKSVVTGREYQKDRANSLRRDIFATELVAAVNKLRLNKNKAYLRRDENVRFYHITLDAWFSSSSYHISVGLSVFNIHVLQDNWLNRIATSEAERIARTCSSKPKQFNYDGKNNVLTTGIQILDKFWISDNE